MYQRIGPGYFRMLQEITMKNLEVLDGPHMIWDTDASPLAAIYLLDEKRDTPLKEVDPADDDDILLSPQPVTMHLLQPHREIPLP